VERPAASGHDGSGCVVGCFQALGDASDTGPFLGLGPVACGRITARGPFRMLPVIKGAANKHPGVRPLRRAYGPDTVASELLALATGGLL